MILKEKIENNLTKYLLKDVAFVLNGKRVVKKGQLILFRLKDFHFVFTLKTDKGLTKEYEIPYPFELSTGTDFIKFNYDIANFTQSDYDLDIKVKIQPRSSKNKLYNSVMFLSAVG